MKTKQTELLSGRLESTIQQYLWKLNKARKGYSKFYLCLGWTVVMLYKMNLRMTRIGFVLLDLILVTLGQN